MASDKSLIPRPTTGLATTPTTSNPILRRMTEGLLGHARQAQKRGARFRLGDYVLCEPDYRLICLWAEDLDMEPAALLAKLADCRYEPPEETPDNPIQFVLEDGALHSLVWDFDQLPQFPDRWIDGLRLHTLAFVWNERLPKSALAPKVSSLRYLHISLSRSTHSSKQPSGRLDLSGVSNLTRLKCESFGLSELDLTPVPGLIELDCWRNQLTELDLTPVLGLTKLNCGWNQLANLDVTPVPGLNELYCWDNQLTQLDLTPVPGLTKLNCIYNQLANLDLTPVPGLIELYCSANRLTKLDLTPVPGLIELYCWDNQLTELDLTPVPGLNELYCGRNQLTELDLMPIPGLTWLFCDKSVIIRNAPPGLEIERNS